MHPCLRKTILILQELRAPFFSAPLMPVVLGTALAFYHTGRCDWWLFALAALGVVFINSAANVANDYFDHRNGNDLPFVVAPAGASSRAGVTPESQLLHMQAQSTALPADCQHGCFRCPFLMNGIQLGYKRRVLVFPFDVEVDLNH